MKEVGIVWQVASGDYEQWGIDGYYDSYDSAVKDTKSTFGKPYIVEWEFKGVDLIGHFEDVEGCSTKHTCRFEISSHPIKG